MNLNFETCWDKMHALLHCCSGRIPHCMHKRALLPCCMGAAWLQWRFSNCMYVHRVPAAAAGTQSALAAIKEKFLVYQGHPWFWRILGSPPFYLISTAMYGVCDGEVGKPSPNFCIMWCILCIFMHVVKLVDDVRTWMNFAYDKSCFFPGT